MSAPTYSPVPSPPPSPAKRKCKDPKLGKLCGADAVGAIIGIAIGGFFMLLLAVLLLWWLLGRVSQGHGWGRGLGGFSIWLACGWAAGLGDGI